MAGFVIGDTGYFSGAFCAVFAYAYAYAWRVRFRLDQRMGQMISFPFLVCMYMSCDGMWHLLDCLSSAPEYQSAWMGFGVD
jgi:hypothetical protein